MQPKTHVIDGVTFVATPYRAGTFIREDVFWRQLTVTCQGYVEYVEDDPIYGTYWVPSIFELGERGLIEDAMALALACVSEHEFDLNPDIDALDFRPELVLVRDSLNRLVLTGQVWGAGIRWSEPITSDEEAAAVAKQVDDLRGEASYEAGWDNYSSAEGLRLRARVLAGRLVDPFWQAHARCAVQAAAAAATATVG
ncbi:hypothetical protein IPC1132_25780 [Pseudomonas aeruginosa]|uniref:hypothetical protein n=1 Tax=Pseudomonas aeruginosa TaxID=287 RepID=UPI000FC41254|nr:hypothetical protein [Pseudomonas aeruginosa]RUF23428.1 hypothetical protein IPC1132_25780 [Pseudomonas aeruginosa]